MGDKRPYDEVRAKVPREDADGNDITAYRFGTGGRRRDDGTIAALGYDVEPFDQDEGEPATALAQFLMVVGAFAVGVGSKMVWDWVKDKRQERLAAKAALVPLPAKATVVEPEAMTPNPERARSVSPARLELPVEFDEVLDQCRKQPTSEEFQLRVVALLWTAADVAQEARDLSNTEIADDVRGELEGKLDKLSAPWVIDMANRALEAKATLLDEAETEAFPGGYGGGAVQDGLCLPLRPERVRDALRLTRETTERDGHAALPQIVSA